MSSARYLIGDTRDVLRTLPDASVDLVMSSPPFLALRSYLPADDPNKPLEIGSESTPGEFLDVLLDVVVECRRVLAPHGTLVFELGDTYSGSGATTAEEVLATNPDRSVRHQAEGHARSISARARQDQLAKKGDGWPLAKSLCMVPSSFAWALAYGRNPWTGREIEPWRVRNIVRWCRPNPPVGALGDKFRPATSEMVVACTGGSRYFDLDAVREPHKRPEEDPREWSGKNIHDPRDGRNNKPYSAPQNAAGAPPLDYWVIPTHPYPGSHYATFPPELCVRPIKAMCPERVCRVCGKPSERITEAAYVQTRNGEPYRSEYVGRDESDRTAIERTGGNVPLQKPVTGRDNGVSRIAETLGWSDCGCCMVCGPNPPPHPEWLPAYTLSKWRRGVVLDPFAGSGTTLEVATGHGRDAIGIDLDARNADLARQRVGMFLDVEELAA